MFIKLFISLLIPKLVLTGTPSVKGVSIHEIPGLNKVNAYTIEPLIVSPSAVAIDATTGQILYKKNHSSLRPIASITKLVTAYEYLKKTNNDLDRLITLNPADKRDGGRRIVYQGEIGTARDFLHLALIASDNSAAMALARAGGFADSFSDVVAKLKQELGLTETNLSDPTGLSSKNVSTALEVARLAREIFKNPIIASAASESNYVFQPYNSNVARKLATTDDLLTTSLFHINSAKTGYTEDAGYSFVVKADNGKGQEIIITILGAPTSDARFQDAKTIAWWIFENFE